MGNIYITHSSHFFSTSLRQKTEGTFSQAVAFFSHTFLFWIQSFWKHRSFTLGKIWLTRHSRTKLLCFLRFFPSLETQTQRSSCHSNRFSPPTRSLWFGNEACLPHQRWKWVPHLWPGTRMCSDFLWIQRKLCVSEYVNWWQDSTCEKPLGTAHGEMCWLLWLTTGGSYSHWAAQGRGLAVNLTWLASSP